MSKIPFFKPWGFGGCLWRFLVYLFGLTLLCGLFAILLKGCDETKKALEEVIENPEQLLPPSVNPHEDNPFDPEKPYHDYPEELIDSSRVDDWIKPIEGVEELPDPDDNFITPIDSTDIITNPEDSISQIVADQLIVLFNSQDIEKDMASFAQQFKQHYTGNEYNISYYNPQTALMLLLVPKQELLQVRNELPKKITNVEYIVTTNGVFSENSRPSDPGFSNANYEEYFKLIQAYEAWDITRGSKDVKVAIVDSYFDLSNPEIADRHVDRIHIPTRTRKVLPPNHQPKDDNELGAYCHGSHVAGLAIGTQNNKLGCSGIAPECTWIPVALGNQLTDLNVLEGLMYAIYRGADVINLSIGRAFPEGLAQQLPLGDQVMISQSMGKGCEALWDYIGKIANDHNCVICTAAGNETLFMGLDAKNRTNKIIKVEAVDGKGQKADFSNYGMYPEANLQYSTVSAPGVKLWSVTDKRCVPIWQHGGTVASKDGFQEMSGTSMASPVVAGAVALLKSKNKNLTTDEIIKILRMTAKQTDTQNRIGPTIQIKDALDATANVDKVKFDDLMNNHNLLVGKWKSTNELKLKNAQTDEHLDNMWTYFTFTSTSEGFIEHRTIQSGRIYTAKLKVNWMNDKIHIDQIGKSVAQDGDTIIEDDFICRPDANGLLVVDVIRNGKKDYDFMLMKVK